MKWLCRVCKAINPQFSYACHNCGTKNEAVGSKAPSRFVKQGKYECGAAALAALIDVPLFHVKRALGRHHWRNDSSGVTEGQLRAVAREFGRDLFWCSKKTYEAMEIIPDAILTLPSLNYPKAYHGVTWRDGEIMDPNFGHEGRKYWGADASLLAMPISSLSVILPSPMSDAEFKELKDLQRAKQFPHTVAMEILKLAGHDLLRAAS